MPFFGKNNEFRRYLDLGYLIQLAFLLISLCSQNALSQASPSPVSFSVQGSIKSFGKNLGFDPAFGYGGGASFSISQTVQAELLIESVHSKKEFDLIGSIGSLNVGITSYQFRLLYKIATIGNSVDLSASAGMGVATLKSSATTISLGALGRVVIPERSENRTLYTTSVRVSKTLAPRVAIQIEPEVFVLSPLPSAQSNYSLTGGITVGLF